MFQINDQEKQKFRTLNIFEMEKMKLVAFTILIFEAIFVQAQLDVPGTLGGTVAFTPTIFDAGNALETFAKRTVELEDALNKTSGCFTTGSSKYVQNVARGLMDAATNISDFGKAFANQTTSEGGQLKLLVLKGNLSQITHAGNKSANALYQLAAYIQDLAHNINKARITSADLKQLVTGMEEIAESIYEFSSDYGAFMSVSITVLNLATAVSGIGKGTKDSAIAIYAAKDATIPIEKRCGASNEISPALGYFGDSATELYLVTIRFL